MKKSITIFVWSISFTANSWAQHDPYVTFGPMIHCNFSDNGYHFSWGLEAAVYKGASNEELKKGIPGVDLGIEFERTKVRLYSEFEYGFAFYGAAIGGFWENDWENHKNSFGPQGSVWLNFFAGVDMRFRGSDNGTVLSPGWYAKLISGL